ncbi:MAG: nuclear pore complex subunit [Bacteroidetes bacterium]|nr:MAG: nuclear pore complex subunit [Bacteroidota bacterium]
MENLIIKGEAKTPTIDFNYSNGELVISGRSIPENSIEFYKPIIEWLESLKVSDKDKIVLDIKLEYFNTSSSKCILDVFKKLEEIKGVGKDASIRWYYESDDEDMEEAGQDFSAIIKVPLELITVEEL